MILDMQKNKLSGRRIIVFTPRQKWGGAIVLHVLAKCLNELGYDARVFYSGVGFKTDFKYIGLFWIKWLIYILKDTIKVVLSKVDKRNKPLYNGYKSCVVKGCKRKYLPFVRKNDVVVYPEIIYGNPLNAHNIIRFLLYYYQYKDDSKAYSEKDLFVAYRDEFNDVDLNPSRYILTIPYFDLDYYKQKNFGKREGKCYIIRKGKNRDDLPKKFDGIVIDNLAEDDKIKVFNNCEYCISYDVQTAYSSLAAICGCKSVIMPLPGQIPEDYRNSDDSREGIAIGLEKKELQYAESTLDNLKNKYQQMNMESIEKVKEFAIVCKEYFK